jgi:hypothetical protein
MFLITKQDIHARRTPRRGSKGTIFSKHEVFYVVVMVTR